MKVLENVDLGKSFDKLKMALKASRDYLSNQEVSLSERYAYSYGMIERAVKDHLTECTDTLNADIPNGKTKTN